MIAFADDERYFYTIQAMIDLDFEDMLDASRIERTRGMLSIGPWEV